MNISPEFNLRLSISILFAISILSLSACKGRTNENKLSNSPGSNAIHENDSSYLFNGKDLRGWEITNFGPQGSVYVSDGAIILGMGDGCTGITYKEDFPLTNYKVTLDAMRVEGTDFFCGLTFPVDKDPCTLIVGGWGGATVGLSSIDLLDASDNETTTIKQFNNKQWYNICLLVKNDTIKALIDDEIVVDFV